METAPSGLAFYTGSLFPQWRGSAFVGGLRSMMLDRLTIRNDKVVGEEPMLTDLRARIREVRVADFHEVGSHILFITSIEQETLAPFDSGVQLFHSFNSYRRHILSEEAILKEFDER